MQWYPGRKRNYWGLFLCFPTNLLDLLNTAVGFSTRTFATNRSLFGSGDIEWKRGLELRITFIIFGLGFSFQHEFYLGAEPETEEEEDDAIYLNTQKAGLALLAITKRGWKNGCVTDLAQATIDDSNIEEFIDPKTWVEINE